MENSNGNLVKSEQIKKLINAVQEYAHELQETGTLLHKASELCIQEMEGDDLSVGYAQVLDNLLGDLATNVFPKLEDLIDALIEEKKRVDETAIINV